MRKLANEDIRNIIREKGLQHFMVFGKLGISESTWTRLLRTPLNHKDKMKILRAVDALSECSEEVRYEKITK